MRDGRNGGRPTEPVRTAAEALLESLAKAQRDRSTFGVDDPEWRKWMNQAFDTRQGVSFLKMTDAQREHLNSVRYTERHTLRDANHTSWRSRWALSLGITPQPPAASLTRSRGEIWVTRPGDGRR